MIKIINKDYPLRREEVTRAEAERRIKELNEPYKLEILEAIKVRGWLRAMRCARGREGGGRHCNALHCIAF